MPSSCRITEYASTQNNINIRIDSAVKAGSDVSMFYDPIITKLCTYHNTRQKTIECMSAALEAFIICGVAHNITFLEAIISHHRFIEGNINTNFIHEEYPDGFVGAKLISEITEVFLQLQFIFLFLNKSKLLL
nr:hypothetical protein [Orientia tsutsugamushi]